MEHTPGPWRVANDQECDAFFIQIISGPKKDIAIVYLAVEDSHGEANARLIAAAPELLDALRLLLEHSESFHDDGETEPAEQHRECGWCAARAVIAKVGA